MNLTNADLKWLAECAGLRQYYAGITGTAGYIDRAGNTICRVIDWQPLTNWNHLRLVLEALVKHEMNHYAFSSGGAWALVLERLAERASIDFIGFDLPEAIIKAALALREEE